MNKSTRLILAAVMAAMALAACKKQEAAVPAAEQAQAAPALPAKDDNNGWKQYLQTVVGQNLGSVTNNPYLYYLPPESDPDFQASYDRQVESVTTSISRGVQPGNMLAFGSSASAKMADLIQAAFKGVAPNSMKGVRVLYIGEAADNDRVKAVIEPTGADYVFVEAK
ncbi:hypothetical protein [Xanthomonas massiliensis]|uniref:hypothetical protein n=1 Tax=Xanthomonas massiliensis TaxID=1720302 RepID=UPI000825FDDF|nr:hypothetical protein [Xanthomonas massiliensis]